MQPPFFAFNAAGVLFLYLQRQKCQQSAGLLGRFAPALGTHTLIQSLVRDNLKGVDFELCRRLFKKRSKHIIIIALGSGLTCKRGQKFFVQRTQ